MVWISIAMILKLLPVCGTPKRSPAGVPVTSPRTMTRSPATSTSLTSNFMSGMDLAKPPTTLIEASRPQHSPARHHEIRDDDLNGLVVLVAAGGVEVATPRLLPNRADLANRSLPSWRSEHFAVR